jgi:outer membrane biosynthesis protein TonB
MRAYFIWKSNTKTLAFGFAFRRNSEAPFFDPRDRRFRTFVMVVLSLLVHLLVLFLLIKYVLMSQGGKTSPAIEGLNVTLGSPQTKSTAAQPPVAPPTPQPTEEPKPEVEPRPRRNVIATPAPSPFHVPSQSNKPLPPLPPLPQSNQPAQPDMSSMIAEKREARDAADERERQLEANGGSSESEDQKARRLIASNLASQRGKEYQEGGGGIFSIPDKGLHDATLIFHGWNHDFGRNLSQQIQVKQGSQPNIEMAIVAEVIRIIRQQYQGDFQWESQRLGKTVTRSARKEDTAALQEFLFQEFDFNDNLNYNRSRDQPPAPRGRPPRPGF